MNTIYRFQQVLKENRIELRFLAISTKGISSKKKKKRSGGGNQRQLGEWDGERGDKDDGYNFSILFGDQDT